MSETPIVYIVDDDHELRFALRFLFEEEGWQVEEFSDAESFLEHAVELKAGCIVLDLRMDNMSGLNLMQQLDREKVPQSILFLSGHGSVRTAVEAMNLGAIDFLEKPIDNDLIVEKVRAAIELSVTPVKRSIHLKKLTAKEKDVAFKLIQGKTNKELAGEFQISIKTIEFHRQNIMRKLEIVNLSDLHAMIG